MIIEIPLRHRKYLELLVGAGLCSSEPEAISWVFARGLDEAMLDSSAAGDPDMDLQLIEGQMTQITVPVSSEHLGQLGEISELYGRSLPETATIVFLQGLFDAWLDLRASELYQVDQLFRRKVDAMPHDSFYEFGFGDDFEI